MYLSVLPLQLFMAAALLLTLNVICSALVAIGDVNKSRQYTWHAPPCYSSDFIFQACCCKEPNAAQCWSRGRHFLRCCAGSLQACRGQRWPQLHVISYGHVTDTAAILAHSVFHWLGTPLLIFGRHRDHEPLPYEAPSHLDIGEHLIRKILFTREVIEEFPPEDLLMYLDATDVLVQRGNRGELLAAFSNVIRDQYKSQHHSVVAEPVVFAGQAHCHPFELWSDGNLENKMNNMFGAETEWHADFFHREYGQSHMGPRLRPREVCALAKGSGSLPFADSGVWVGRVRSAQILFGIWVGVAVAEKAIHCMEALKLVQVWFPGLAVVDSEMDLFWTTEIELSAKNGYEASESHPAVQNIKSSTTRDLCTLGGYWLDGHPAPLKSTGSAPFILHHAGPAKATLGRRCSGIYAQNFIEKGDRWLLHDLDARKSVRLSLNRFEGIAFGLISMK